MNLIQCPRCLKHVSAVDDCAVHTCAATPRWAELEADNIRLRAALAMSKSPCAYCSLPAEEWSKCVNGFPGCDRADDAMGCPHLGAAMETSALEAECARLREDAARLDWMAEYAQNSDGSFSFNKGSGEFIGDTYRAAIDAALRGEEAK